MTEPLIKKRKITVVGMDDPSSANKLLKDLKKKEGIISIEVNGKKGLIELNYDLNKINFEAIEKIIKDLGFNLSQRIREKFKRGMAKFTEQNELDNLYAAPSSCCSDPKESCHRTNG